jgi:hypothetical protein
VCLSLAACGKSSAERERQTEARLLQAQIEVIASVAQRQQEEARQEHAAADAEMQAALAKNAAIDLAASLSKGCSPSTAQAAQAA